MKAGTGLMREERLQIWVALEPIKAQCASDPQASVAGSRL